MNNMTKQQFFIMVAVGIAVVGAIIALVARSNGNAIPPFSGILLAVAAFLLLRSRRK